MQVVILCDQKIGVLRINRFYYFLISFDTMVSNAFFHAFSTREGQDIRDTFVKIEHNIFFLL